MLLRCLLPLLSITALARCQKANAVNADLSGGVKSPAAFETFAANRSEATSKGLSFLPPPAIHKMILRKILAMELPDLRETVNELASDVTRTESALGQVDGALVMQFQRMDAIEKAVGELEKKLDQQGGLISQVMKMKNGMAGMERKIEALSKIVIAEWEQIPSPVGSLRVKSHPMAKSWDEASRHCQIYSASLVRISNEETNRQISELLKFDSSFLHWIGVEGRQQVDRMPFHRFAKPKRVCIAFEKDGSWVSRDCNEKLPFICGYEDGPANSITSF